ncbi:hypothetical protein COY65_00395 [Candidatus Jorgensenbacteria bacterium CG_4_10_14_0_8_um_filter_39_13]|uniref:GtrA/DPMS transmembrane domain-containing protein n=2 Tax=Candidatus Joergenseniibacteriota TaxID=1752739 RepID=A0A2M7RIF5_9BACT|nr:MAG: hypothetical protein COV54_02695 [Candidatus Jorgensenbacteria bacterium CG11_big_fil_rev_8_21_14_0_20_38_23]PIV13111.1 MAG: hypothetical protein COS46_01865 [Candidatus Jorgensenbacteria bacterium CG03_land_8_20_14_0_80_38_39]PIW97574.1 MAG: hypothetical protein COZ81_01885 [Candidatus Jorgensenbacteria bacterium CG_4_8_14_3_um_filter_38_10]PIY96519.1 MAG: hypothetical protein COY65_00395 [Candidatus Jorgensenbacteria bacterium CG_4_10_14_0_8_um_filter_39_13]PJA94961.1 MAG: hypothetica
MNKKDYYLVTLIGFLVGFLVLLPLASAGVKITIFIVLVSVMGFSLFAPLALWWLKILSRFFPVLEQIGKFAAVGVLNTVLDFGVLNLLILATNIASGWSFSLFKAISFLVASANSYFWNKFWTFQSRTPANFKEYTRFFVFSLLGALINVGVASFLVNVVGPIGNFNFKIWANISALIAVLISLIWNFLTYRYIVFKKSDTSDYPQ